MSRSTHVFDSPEKTRPSADKPPVARLKRSERGFWVQLRRLPRAWVGGAMVATVVLLAIFAPVLAPLDPLEQFRSGLSDIGTPLPPGGSFLLGTDHLGRDMWSRMLYGARVSLLVSFIANGVAAIFGTLVGMVAGYYSGILDTLLMRFTDILLAFPAILLALGLGSVLRPSVPVVVIILTVITWPALARLVRSQAANTVSQPSSLVRAVSSETLSVGA